MLELLGFFPLGFGDGGFVVFWVESFCSDFRERVLADFADFMGGFKTLLRGDFLLCFVGSFFDKCLRLCRHASPLELEEWY